MSKKTFTNQKIFSFSKYLQNSDLLKQIKKIAQNKSLQLSIIEIYFKHNSTNTQKHNSFLQTHVLIHKKNNISRFVTLNGSIGITKTMKKKKNVDQQQNYTYFTLIDLPPNDKPSLKILRSLDFLTLLSQKKRWETRKFNEIAANDYRTTRSAFLSYLSNQTLNDLGIKIIQLSKTLSYPGYGWKRMEIEKNQNQFKTLKILHLKVQSPHKRKDKKRKKSKPKSNTNPEFSGKKVSHPIKQKSENDKQKDKKNRKQKDKNNRKKKKKIKKEEISEESEKSSESSYLSETEEPSGSEESEKSSESSDLSETQVSSETEGTSEYSESEELSETQESEEPSESSDSEEYNENIKEKSKKKSKKKDKVNRKEKSKKTKEKKKKYKNQNKRKGKNNKKESEPSESSESSDLSETEVSSETEGTSESSESEELSETEESSESEEPKKDNLKEKSKKKDKVKRKEKSQKNKQKKEKYKKKNRKKKKNNKKESESSESSDLSESEESSESKESSESSTETEESEESEEGKENIKEKSKKKDKDNRKEKSKKNKQKGKNNKKHKNNRKKKKKIKREETSEPSESSSEPSDLSETEESSESEEYNESYTETQESGESSESEEYNENIKEKSKKKDKNNRKEKSKNKEQNEKKQSEQGRKENKNSKRNKNKKDLRNIKEIVRINLFQNNKELVPNPMLEINEFIKNFKENLPKNAETKKILIDFVNNITKSIMYSKQIKNIDCDKQLLFCKIFDYIYELILQETHSQIIAIIKKRYKEDIDIQFRSTISNMNYIKLKHFQINKKDIDIKKLATASVWLEKINQSILPSKKLFIINTCVNYLLSSFKKKSDLENKKIFLLLSYIIFHSKISNIKSNVQYIQLYHFSEQFEGTQTEINFKLFKLAIQFLENLKGEKLKKNQTPWRKYILKLQNIVIVEKKDVIEYENDKEKKKTEDKGKEIDEKIKNAKSNKDNSNNSEKIKKKSKISLETSNEKDTLNIIPNKGETQNDLHLKKRAIVTNDPKKIHNKMNENVENGETDLISFTKDDNKQKEINHEKENKENKEHEKNNKKKPKIKINNKNQKKKINKKINLEENLKQSEFGKFFKKDFKKLSLPEVYEFIEEYNKLHSEFINFEKSSNLEKK
ncbi:rab gdp/gtp exchange factor [Anaeramoeba flamelloides]|uniref:Rab gdp/gtp exchange factor n=1 Tax=Anaeramoeba flamelloides TaxID=1746091 RepID=A0ABQ8XXT7_9EUKA|nr:rab gdp/gtp exchange factor [Anaeramoeba flamelloides]